MKKLVMLSAFLSPYRSGAEAMVEEVSSRLTKDFEITIITARMDRSNPANDTMADGRIKIIRVGLGFGFDKWLYPFLARSHVARLKPDIVHSVLETFAGLALKMCRGTYKRVLTLQTTNRSFLKKSIVMTPDQVTAISEALKDIAESFGRTDVTVIPNGIDLSAFEKAKKSVSRDSGRVLFVGRLEQMKGVDTLLRSFKRAIAGLPPSIHLHIVGDGSERKKLEALAKELEIDHRVKFLGKIDHTEVAKEYASSEIFVGLSRSEALGNVFLEAQASGCVVLGTDVQGIPDIVKHEETGILVPPNDEEAASLALRKLLTDTPLRAKLAKAGMQHAKEYDWNSIAARYKEVLLS